MTRPKPRRWTGVTVSKVDWINGQLVTFLGWSNGYPWVRTVDGRTFVWSEEDIRPLTADEAQLQLPEVTS